jgi:hypothetical protein
VINKHFNKQVLWVAGEPKAPTAGNKVGGSGDALLFCALLLHQ